MIVNTLPMETSQVFYSQQQDNIIFFLITNLFSSFDIDAINTQKVTLLPQNYNFP